MPTVNEVVPAYIKLRDQIKAIEEQHKAQLAPLKQHLQVMDTWLLGELARAGIDNMAVRGVGTVIKKVQHRVSVGDWSLTWPWLSENERFDLLNQAVNKTGVVEYVHQYGVPPPGVNYSAEFTVEVQRARGT